jgi:uncharacterized cupredoxin-like copper-binding protein
LSGVDDHYEGGEAMYRIAVGLVLGFVALALMATGCGSDDDDSGGGGDSSIEATMQEFEFTPTDWTVAAGEEITVDLTNDGAIEHEWVILQDGVTIDSESELPETEDELLADFVYWEDEVEPGDSKTLTFTAPAAGTYQVICAIPEHFDAGMEGELTAS